MNPEDNDCSCGHSTVGDALMYLLKSITNNPLDWIICIFILTCFVSCAIKS